MAVVTVLTSIMCMRYNVTGFNSNSYDIHIMDNDDGNIDRIRYKSVDGKAVSHGGDGDDDDGKNNDEPNKTGCERT